MPEFTHLDLRKAREARKLTRWQLGNEIGVSESTIERWEKGEVLPSPDDIDRIGDALKSSSLWHQWMISNVESYRKRYKAVPDVTLQSSLARIRYVAEDVMEHFEVVDRDAINGKIENTEACRQLIAKLQDAIGAMTYGVQVLKDATDGE